MSGYYGTEAQQRLQRKSDRLTSWIMCTPGACLTGRLLGADDPEKLGWDIIHEHLAEDGVFSFRWIDQAGFEEISRQVNGICKSIFSWRGFYSTAEVLHPAISDALAQPLPAGLRLEVASGNALTESQAFLSQQGISPLSTAVLGGKICQARTVIIRQEMGAIVAVGFIGMMQNQYSPMHDCAWLGLIGCGLDQRGKGLGRHITAELIRLSLTELGAKRVMAFAAADNTASKALLRGCGLHPTDRTSYVATLSEGQFTR